MVEGVWLYVHCLFVYYFPRPSRLGWQQRTLASEIQTSRGRLALLKAFDWAPPHAHKKGPEQPTVLATLSAEIFPDLVGGLHTNTFMHDEYSLKSQGVQFLTVVGSFDEL